MQNKYLLIRHGESQYNEELRYQGWSKRVHLTKQGIEQVKGRIKLVKKFKPDLVVASPFLRTRQTAEILASAIKKEVLYSKLIIDYNRSESMEGKLQEEYVGTKKYKEWLEKADKDWNFHLPDGESYNGFDARIREFIEILETSYDKKKILIVSHGDVIRSIIRQYADREFQRIDVMNVFVCELIPNKKAKGKYIFKEVN